MLCARLLKWLASPENLDAHLFAPGATFDSPLSPERTIQDRFLGCYAPFERARPILATGDSGGGVIVFEACDPVTNLWHRVAWVFIARENAIVHIVETSSQGLPPREQRYPCLVHEIWRTPDGAELCCIAGPSGDGARESLEQGAQLLHVFEANSHFEAMSIYNTFLEREPYTTSEPSDFIFYPESWLAVQAATANAWRATHASTLVRRLT
jgi:hypothetical protein